MICQCGQDTDLIKKADRLGNLLLGCSGGLFAELEVNMEVQLLEKELSGCDYPGRGIVLGRSSDGKYAVSAYFIMGRSENSRNRVFVLIPSPSSTKTRLRLVSHLPMIKEADTA